MSKLKLPNLHKGVTKIGMDITVLSDYIYVSRYHGLITNVSGIIAVNLKDLLYDQTAADDEVDYKYERYLDVIEYLDGKFITPGYWQELVSAFDVELKTQAIGDPYVEIETRGIRKELFYVPPAWEHDEQKDEFVAHYDDMLSKYALKEELTVQSQAIDMSILAMLISIFGKKIVGDYLIVASHGGAHKAYFTFYQNKTIFGIINTHYEASTEIFKKLNLENYVSDEVEREVYEQASQIDVEVEPDKKHPNLFTLKPGKHEED